MNQNTYDFTKKMLLAFEPVKVLCKKRAAITKIKMQPFFGEPLFSIKCDTITFRRPAAYRS